MDISQLAHRIVQRATGEEPDAQKEPKEQPKGAPAATDAPNGSAERQHRIPRQRGR